MNEQESRITQQQEDAAVVDYNKPSQAAAEADAARQQNSGTSAFVERDALQPDDASATLPTECPCPAACSKNKEIAAQSNGLNASAEMSRPGETNDHDADTGSSEPGEEASEQASDREDSEGTQRRILLEAGTDEASLNALALCREQVAALRLRMRPLAARWEDDRHVIIFFRAEDKVDFRKLVRELSRLLHARIELRQVSPREQGKLCGLVGKCGYPLCCQTFLGQFAQSTIKMAKTQELALNPMKISGVCGRLLCCLNYEQEMYLDAKSRLPKVNRIIETELGPGKVIAVNALKETVTVQLESATRELRADQILPAEPQS